MIVCIAHAKVGYRQAIFKRKARPRKRAGLFCWRVEKKLAGYILRASMALENMAYDADTGTVIHRSKMHLGLGTACDGKPLSKTARSLGSHRLVESSRRPAPRAVACRAVVE